jgi:hypothetical protein
MGEIIGVSGLKKGHQRLWVQFLVKVWDTRKKKRFASFPGGVTKKGMCYKKNMSIEMDPTYLW